MTDIDKEIRDGRGKPHNPETRIAELDRLEYVLTMTDKFFGGKTLNVETLKLYIALRKTELSSGATEELPITEKERSNE